MTTETTTYDKKFNAQRGAKRAGLEPGAFEAVSYTHLTLPTIYSV